MLSPSVARVSGLHGLRGATAAPALQILPVEPMRRPLFFLVLAAAVTSGHAAGASPAPDWTTGDIEMELRLPDGDGGFEPTDDVSIREHFNRANCLCEDVEFAVRFSLVDVPATLDPDPVRVWFGSNCDSSMTQERDQNCTMEYEFTDVEALRNPQDVPFPVSSLTESCDPNEAERNVYALIDPENNGINTEEGDYTAEPLPITADTRPPPAPHDIEASGGESAVQISWTLPDTNIEDVKYFQVLCARADGSVDDADDFPRSSPLYLTSAEACGAADESICPQPASVSRVTPGGIDAAAIDAAPAADAGAVTCTDLPGELETLGPMHVCADADGTESSVRVEGLENGVAYRIVLVVVDPARNPYALDLGEHTPSQVKDFWEHYHDRGGTAEGGCDLVGGSSGAAAALVLFLAAVLFAPGRRRRGRRIGGALLLLFAGGQVASAQPWWESASEDVQEEVGPAPVHWDLEIKFGPYVPAIDSEFDLGADEVGPFEQMFGDGPFLMSGMTLDRYFVHPAGQLGLTSSIGFLTKSARAFQVDGNGDVVTNEDGVPIRASGDSNKFRLIPMSLGVVYRYTQLDDLFHIMVVPYGRLGLSYYYWWVTSPSGDIAQVPTDDCPDLEDCTGDKARGGSLGWQATGGLALRLERIDPDAEVALRTELGIEHAGFMVEYTHAVVDGFGSDKKLSVGDGTWFGGINFEF
jgi:hypothetical protein